MGSFWSGPRQFYIESSFCPKTTRPVEWTPESVIIRALSEDIKSNGQKWQMLKFIKQTEVDGWSMSGHVRFVSMYADVHLVIRSYCQVSILFGPQRTVNLVQLPGVQFVIGISSARTRVMVKMRSEPEVNILKFPVFENDRLVVRTYKQTHIYIKHKIYVI